METSVNPMETSVDDPRFEEVSMRMVKFQGCYFKKDGVNRADLSDDKAVEIKHEIKSDADLDLKLVKSETCTVKFPELDLEGVDDQAMITNIRGLCMSQLKYLQKRNRYSFRMEDEVEKWFEWIVYPGLRSPVGLTIILDDYFGNSCIENADETRKYERTPEQNWLLWDKLEEILGSQQ